jgi:hypothetical protein
MSKGSSVRRSPQQFVFVLSVADADASGCTGSYSLETTPATTRAVIMLVGTARPALFLVYRTKPLSGDPSPSLWS